jgi:hypothetical protein
LLRQICLIAHSCQNGEQGTFGSFEISVELIVHLGIRGVFEGIEDLERLFGFVNEIGHPGEE